MEKTTKYFVDIEGNYIGAFEGSEPPVGSIEIDSPPEDARDVLEVNGTWTKYKRPYDELRREEYLNGDYIDALMDFASSGGFKNKKMSKGLSDAILHWKSVKTKYPKEDI